MSFWTIVAQLAALAILIRMVCILNASKCHGKIDRWTAAVILMAVAAVGVILAPVWAYQFDWPACVLIVGMAQYIYFDRRIRICSEKTHDHG